MANQFERTIALIGEEGVQLLNNSKVAVFGLGGVGSFAAEALVRAGIGELLFIDNDIIAKSNLNRQLIALHSTIGCYKVDIMERRAKDINPHIIISTKKLFFDATTLPLVQLDDCNYIVDAIDTVSSKLILIDYAAKHSIPLISSMGTGNKLNPTMFKVADIFQTKNCPLARVMRHEIKKAKIKNVKVVYSEENPAMQNFNETKRTPSSISFVPSTAGMIMAGEVINDILKGATYA